MLIDSVAPGAIDRLVQNEAGPADVKQVLDECDPSSRHEALEFLLQGMGAIEVHVNASSKLSLLKSTTGSQLRKQKASSGGCAKPPRASSVAHTSCSAARVIHTYSPRVYKIQPEEFLELVQKLTGKSVTPTTPPRTFQFFETGASRSSIKTENSRSSSQEVATAAQFSQQQFAPQFADEFPISGEVLDTRTTRNLLGALPSPGLVTLNFLPLLALTPGAQH